MTRKNQTPGRRLAGVAVLVLAGLATGCATPPPASDPEAMAEYEQINDPAEPTNRAIFDFNDGLDKAAIKPAAEGYHELPSPVRVSVRNFLTNWSEPLVFIHDLLQGEVSRAGETLTRFVTNTTVGFLGVGDVASEGMDIHHHDEDMGQTLAVWGVGDGPFMMLPFFGPSNARDTVGKVVDFFIDPVGFAVSVPDAAGWSKTAVSGVDKREQYLDTLDEVERSSLDYYASMRTLYRQHRNDEISNGNRADAKLDTGLQYSLKPRAAQETLSQR